MAYVIGATCIGTRDRSCVDVCPVDCITAEPEDEMLFIDPVTCIDCAACVEVCPVEAIHPQAEVPAEWADFTHINRVHFEDAAAARALVRAWTERA